MRMRDRRGVIAQAWEIKMKQVTIFQARPIPLGGSQHESTFHWESRAGEEIKKLRKELRRGIGRTA